MSSPGHGTARRHARPGRNPVGQCITSPFSNLVSVSCVPPSALTCFSPSMPGPPNTIVPESSHTPCTQVPLAMPVAIVTGLPPVSGTFRSSPPSVKNPMARPSGEKNGWRPRYVPGDRRCRSWTWIARAAARRAPAVLQDSRSCIRCRVPSGEIASDCPGYPAMPIGLSAGTTIVRRDGSRGDSVPGDTPASAAAPAIRPTRAAPSGMSWRERGVAAAADADSGADCRSSRNSAVERSRIRSLRSLIKTAG